ncbi:MAG: hypothetical protein KDA91_24885 [Planctomycetaceae bacterium]|nr:hypothetical protein [Planctomycetaceae bacterium]
MFLRIAELVEMAWSLSVCLTVPIVDDACGAPGLTSQAARSAGAPATQP